MTDGRQEGKTAGLARLLTADHLWPLAVLSCLFAFVSTHPIRPHDFWWHLKIGQEIVQTGQIPQVDHYSYTMPGQPYPSYNVYWLSDVLLYRVYALGGPALSVFVHTLVIVGTYLLLFLLCRRLAANARIATAALVAAAMLGFENWNVRPQAITFLLFTLALWLIYAFRTNLKTPRWLVLGFPALMLVWVNCHGSFALEIVVLGIWAVETAWERVRIGARSRREVWVPLAAIALSACAMLLNPQGVGIFAYLRHMGDNPVVQQLPEWAPASLATKDGIAFFVLGSLGLALLLWAGRARSGLFHWLMLVFFGILAVRTGRAIIWFGLVLAPIAAELLPRVWPAARTAATDLYERLPAASAPRGWKPLARAQEAGTAPKSDRAVVALLMLCFVGLMVVTLPWFKDRLPLPPQKAGLISQETPVAAVDFVLKHDLPPRVFHDMSYGSYLVWRASPQYRVFVDPRVELYPDWLWESYHAISRGDQGWEHTVDTYGINTLLLSRQDQGGLIVSVAASDEWRQLYQDRVSVVFVRRRPVMPP